MSYDSDEKSAALSRPVDLYDFAVASGTTYRYTSFNLPVTFGGNTYTPEVIERAPIHATAADAQDFWIAMPYDNAFVSAQAFIMPSRSTGVTITRLQRNSGGSRVLWIGSVAGFGSDGGTSRMIKIKVPSLLDLALAVPIPSVLFQPHCNHQLYDSGCTVNPATFQVSTNLTIFDNVLTYTATSVGSRSLVGGVIKVTASGEQRTIMSQNGTALTVNAVLPGSFVNPTAVTLLPGCNHVLDGDCLNVFANVANFLGMPYMQPARNAWHGDQNPHSLQTG